MARRPWAGRAHGFGADAPGFRLVSETEHARWYKDSSGVKMMVLTKDVLINVSGGTYIEGAPVGCVPEDRGINLASGINVTGAAFSLSCINITADSTMFFTYTTIPGVSQVNQQEGTVIIYY